MLHRHMANQCIKFEVSSFSRSRDILWGTKNLSGSRDHNNTPFGGSLSSLWQDLISSLRVQNLTALASVIPEIWMGASKILNGSRDLTTPLSETICRP